MKFTAATLLVLLLVNTAGLSTGHAQSSSSDIMPAEIGSGGTALSGAARIIASLQLTNRRVIEFVDLQDGHVGVAERGPMNRRSASIALATAWNATPLEIFMALAPRGSVAPRALKGDHDDYVARTGRDPSPRSLVFALDDPGIEDFPCDPTGANFYFEWFDTFENVTDYVFAGYGHSLNVQYTFYPGKHVYEGTNSNDVTYLGACNGDDVTPMTLVVHRRVKIVTPPAVSYSWVEIGEVVLGYDQKYTFYSNLPANYRGRIRALGMGEEIDHFSLGVAYTKSPGLATP